MNKLHIVADENIPDLEACFGDIGHIQRVPGRSLTSEQLDTADILLVRSVTQVNAHLLASTPIKFVGSCTIGIDHLDTTWLAQQNIGWSAAPGCNANSVVEYVFCALAALQIDWRRHSFGIIGCGNVGGLLQRRLRQLGIACLVYDPWLTDNPDVATLDEVLQQGVICLHAPLVSGGLHPSLHLLGAEQLQKIPADGILISAGRGAVVDNSALRARLERGKPLTAILDVWENEPAIDPHLLQTVALGTPHIAGYSHDGKLAGTRMIRAALNRFLQLPVSEPADQTTAERRQLEVDSGKEGFAALRSLLLQMYDPRDDDRRLRETGKFHPSMAQGFDRLRREYPQRLEFSHYQLAGEKLDSQLRSQLAILGLRCS